MESDKDGALLDTSFSSADETEMPVADDPIDEDALLASPEPQKVTEEEDDIITTEPEIKTNPATINAIENEQSAEAGLSTEAQPMDVDPTPVLSTDIRSLKENAAAVPVTTPSSKDAPVAETVAETTASNVMETSVVNKAGGATSTSSEDTPGRQKVVEITADDVAGASGEKETEGVAASDMSLLLEVEDGDLETEEPAAAAAVISRNRPSYDTESLDLSDPENRPKARRRRSRLQKDSPLDHRQVDCINTSCESGVGLKPSPVAIMTYYGVRRDKNVLQRVCDACAVVAEKHYRVLADMAKNKICILNAQFPPPCNDNVVVVDKVEEICDNEQYFSREQVEFIEKNFDDCLKSAIEKCDLNFQIEESNKILKEKYDNLTEKVAEVNGMFKEWEDELAELRNGVYELFTPKIEEQPAVDLTEPGATFEELMPLSNCPVRVVGKPQILPKCVLPPTVVIANEVKEIEAVAEVKEAVLRKQGPPSYPPLEKGTPVYILRSTMYGPWLKGAVYDVSRKPVWAPEAPQQPKRLGGLPGMYNVRFDDSRHGLPRITTGKSLAYTEPSELAYPVSTRIIARLRNPDDLNAPEAYYAGIIAEPQKQINKNRYLVFFEHGFAQYVPHEKILYVCEVSGNVCDDLAKESRDFVAGYLAQYPERPMVRLQQDQVVRTEWNGGWWNAKVIEVDASMVQMQFGKANRKEWIYRGSTRLKPLYSELVQKNRSLGTSFLKKRNMPYVEYNREVSEDKNSSRNVAKKSTTPIASTSSAEAVQPVQMISNVPPKMFERMEFATSGYVRQIDLSDRVVGRTFENHRCGVQCVSWTEYTTIPRRNVPPLVVPLKVGYSRAICRAKGKRYVAYVTPCGRRIRNFPELRLFLHTTNNELGVDHFDFDHWVKVTDEFHLDKSMYKTYIEDMSDGAENMAVSCVNEIHEIWPQKMKYLTQRCPQQGVNLNTDPAFMVCCDCTDDCSRKENCACWKLTIAGTAQGPEGVVDPSVGYEFRRLPEPVVTGIYECHSGCKCKKTCLNRVVQHPLSQKLQVFRTLHKGWGVRTLNDIPLGAFICIYVGRLNTEAGGNDDGRKYGDEYLAELDYIEVVENMKEGFEADVNQEDFPVEEDGEEEERRGKDKEYVPDEYVGGTQPKRSTRGRRVSDEVECIDLEDNSMDGVQPSSSSFTPAHADDNNKQPKVKSVREMLGDGPDEVYIMDAKIEGNIGRYLNHSCSPNTFVQNVFVDTHDVRFPWITFFANSHIRAGTELTWDYNYNIGSVPDKVLYCYCGNPDCKGRLL